MKGHLTNAVLMLLSGILTAVLVYLFYHSELRNRVENKLFDIRTRLAPDLVSTDKVAVVAIDQQTIDKLEADHPAPAAKPGKPADLRPETFNHLIQAVLQTNAETVVALVPPQIFPYEDRRTDELAALAKSHPRLILGTFDQSAKQARSLLPDTLQPVRSQIVKADLTRGFRRDIIREIVVAEADELPYLPAFILKQHDQSAFDALMRQMKDDKVSVELNYVRPRHIKTLRAEDVLANPKSVDLKGRVVLIGYTAYRPWTFRDREATFVNTPWQAEGDDVKDGFPVVMLHAIALVNLLEHYWLSPVPLNITILQAILVAIVALLTWRWSVGFASLLFIGGWSMILIGHALLFSLGHVHVPLADAFLWSSMATVAGASLKLREEGRLRALQEARFRAEKELAETQDRFLSRLAVELAGINGRVTGILKGLSTSIPVTGTVQTAYAKALGSSEELGDYLKGILQFASLREHELARPTLATVDVAQVVQQVIRQFDSRRHETKLAFDVRIPDDIFVLADRTLAGQIIYNLVSNAVKYSPSGGTILISTERRPSTVLIRVKDEGPGIAPEFHEQIFEKFYRVKDDFVYKHKGHGLGLYLSRFFARQIGASITVESAVGKGAEFTLELKAARA